MLIRKLGIVMNMHKVKGGTEYRQGGATSKLLTGANTYSVR